MNQIMHEALRQEAMLHQTLEAVKEAIYQDIMREEFCC